MSEPKHKPFEITRVFDAPRALVFKAWTEAERLAQWWGPKGMKLTVDKIDLRVGGEFFYSMQMPDGKSMHGKFVYREITPPEKLVFVVCFVDKTGKPIRHPFSATWPLEMLSTLTLTEKDGKTTLHMTSIPVNATQEEHETFFKGHTSMQQGWGGTLEGLEAYLAKA